MKLSALMRNLAEALNTHGDVEVRLYGHTRKLANGEEIAVYEPVATTYPIWQEEVVSPNGKRVKIKTNKRPYIFISA